MANDLQSLMKQAKEMQQKMQDAQSRIASIRIIGQAGGGLVKAYMNGLHQCQRVEIAHKLLQEDDHDMLEDLVAAAINNASEQIEGAAKEEMSGIAKSMSLPTDLMGGEDES